MDFEIRDTPEQERFRQEVRSWFQANVPEGINKRPEGDEESAHLYGLRRELGRKMGTMGWLFPLAPKQYGGGGMDADHAVIIFSEAARFDLMVPPFYNTGGLLGSATTLVWGTEEQKHAFLPPIYRGEWRAWQLLTEPAAGSDLANAQLRAVRDGDDYVLTGQKIFVGSDHGADMIFTLTCTDPGGPRHKNLSWFWVDGHSDRIRIQPLDLLWNSIEGGQQVGRKNVVYFDGVRVPAFNRIGEENDGWRVAGTHLELEHGFNFFRVLGLRSRQLWDQVLEYARTTTRNGRPIAEDPAVRDFLAEVYIRGEVERLFELRNFWLISQGRTRSYEGAQAAYYRKMTGLWMTKAIAEVVGPFALTSDETWAAAAGYLEMQQREGISAVHPGGTADIQRMVMARRIGVGRPTREAAGSAAGE